MKIEIHPALNSKSSLTASRAPIATSKPLRLRLRSSSRAETHTAKLR